MKTQQQRGNKPEHCRYQPEYKSRLKRVGLGKDLVNDVGDGRLDRGPYLFKKLPGKRQMRLQSDFEISKFQNLIIGVWVNPPFAEPCSA